MGTRLGLIVIFRQAVVWFALIAQVGIIMIVSIYLGYRIGLWADQLFSRGMLFTIIGALIGIAVGFASVYRLLMGVIQREK